MDLFTIGFGKKSARQFFTALKDHTVKQLIDIRLNNTSQLAGYTKKGDLEFFLYEITGIEYVHIEDFAPTKEILDDYKHKKSSWDEYEIKYKKLLLERNSIEKWDMATFDRACLLCSEPTAKYCHRRLLAEFLATRFPDLNIIHL